MERQRELLWGIEGGVKIQKSVVMEPGETGGTHMRRREKNWDIRSDRKSAIISAGQRSHVIKS